MGIKFYFLENKGNQNPRRSVIVTTDDFFVPTNFLSLPLSEDQWEELLLSSSLSRIFARCTLFLSINDLIKTYAAIPEWRKELQDSKKRLEITSKKVGLQPFAYEAHNYSALWS